MLEAELDQRDTEIIRLRTQKDMDNIFQQDYRKSQIEGRIKSVDAMKGDRYRDNNRNREKSLLISDLNA
jgi:hypothetical protein